MFLWVCYSRLLYVCLFVCLLARLVGRSLFLSMPFRAKPILCWNSSIFQCCRCQSNRTKVVRNSNIRLLFLFGWNAATETRYRTIELWKWISLHEMHARPTWWQQQFQVFTVFLLLLVCDIYVLPFIERHFIFRLKSMQSTVNGKRIHSVFFLGCLHKSPPKSYKIKQESQNGNCIAIQLFKMLHTIITWIYIYIGNSNTHTNMPDRYPWCIKTFKAKPIIDGILFINCQSRWQQTNKTIQILNKSKNAEHKNFEFNKCGLLNYIECNVWILTPFDSQIECRTSYACTSLSQFAS